MMYLSLLIWVANDQMSWVDLCFIIAVVGDCHVTGSATRHASLSAPVLISHPCSSDRVAIFVIPF
jgi:hypothetical protein